MQDRVQLQEILDDMPAIQLAVVFGSQARSHERPGSDLDLGFLLDPDTLDGRREIEVAMGRAARCPVDIVFLAETPPLLNLQIARDGVVLVERQSGAWARFKSRAMIEWWDWAPTARRIQSAQLRRLRQRVVGDRQHGHP